MTVTEERAYADVASVVASWFTRPLSNLGRGQPGGWGRAGVATGAGKTEYFAKAFELAQDWAGLESQRRRRRDRARLPSAQPVIDGSHRERALRHVVESAAAWAHLSVGTLERRFTEAADLVAALVAFVGRRVPQVCVGRRHAASPAELRIAPLSSAPCAPPTSLSIHLSEGLPTG